MRFCPALGPEMPVCLGLVKQAIPRFGGGCDSASGGEDDREDRSESPASHAHFRFRRTEHATAAALAATSASVPGSGTGVMATLLTNRLGASPVGWL
jgi:anti-sigma factor RsiW